MGEQKKFNELVEGKDYIDLEKREKGLQKIISKIHAERDWEQDAKKLYKALSRLYDDGSDEAYDMAFDILSEVSVDFRNEYTEHTWSQN